MMPDALLPPSKELIEIEHKECVYREFCAAALTGILSGKSYHDHDIAGTAKLAHKYAAAMMEHLF